MNLFEAKTRLAAALAAAMLTLAPTTTQAGGYRGPHPVLAYGGNEYAFVILPAGNGAKALTVYRAMGSALWKRLGGTIIRRGQRVSNGSVIQNIWFKGRRIRSVSGDLRLPFYRFYEGGGGRRVN